MQDKGGKSTKPRAKIKQNGEKRKNGREKYESKLLKLL
jgi:hypothetical protein